MIRVPKFNNMKAAPVYIKMNIALLKIRCHCTPYLCLRIGLLNIVNPQICLILRHFFRYVHSPNG